MDTLTSFECKCSAGYTVASDGLRCEGMMLTWVSIAVCSTESLQMWMSVLWGPTTANKSVSMLRDHTNVIVRKDLLSTVMEERVGYPVVGNIQLTVVASTLPAGPPNIHSTSGVSGTSVQPTPPPTQSSPSLLTTLTMEYTGEIPAPLTISDSTTVARLLPDHLECSVASWFQVLTTRVPVTL